MVRDEHWMEWMLKSLCQHMSTRLQWRRQRSKGARSSRGQKIFQPGHADA